MVAENPLSREFIEARLYAQGLIIESGVGDPEMHVELIQQAARFKALSATLRAVGAKVEADLLNKFADNQIIVANL